jgi:FimV-like protein
LRPLSALATDDGHIGLLTGIASTRSGDLEQGVRHLENALSAQPNDQRVRLELARAYLVAGRNSEASELLRDGFADGSEPALEAAVIRLFAEVGIGNAPKSDEAAAALVATFPDKARALTAVAAFELHRGRTEQADALLERAAASDAEYAPARLLRVERLIQQGRTDEAEAELNAAAARDPGVESQLALVRLYVRLGRLDEAGRLIASAEEEARGDPGVLATQGILALARGAAADAVRYLAAAQAARPDRIGIVVWLAQAQLASGATDQARATLVGALARVPSSPQLRSALAMLELSAGNAGAADGLAHALQTEFPRDAAGFLIAGEVAIASRFYDDAAENFEQAFAREPAWPVRQRWINALQLAGHGSEVLEQYVAAATEEPENVVALNNAAWLLQLQGRSDEALPIAQRANRVAPNNASVLDTLGWILLSKGRGQDAVSYLEKAVALEPNAVEIRYHLAVALAQSGDAAQARNLLEELLDDHRPFDQRAEAQALLERL